MRQRRVRLTLLESTRRGWAWLFTPWQLAGISAVIVATLAVAKATTVPTVLPKPVLESLAQFIAPPKPEILVARTERLSLVGIGSAPGQEAGKAQKPQKEGTAPVEGGVGNQAEEEVISVEETTDDVRPRTEIEVDSAAALDPTAVGPDYPQSLLEKNIEGVVKAQFVVDSLGRVDLSTFRLLEPADSDFVAAVKQALPRMKYRPAIFGGLPVPQLVQQAFGFRIRKADSMAKADSLLLHAVPSWQDCFLCASNY